MEKEIHSFHYDAFISYRHTQPDQFIAENLHKQLEAFRLPKNIERKRRQDQKNGAERSGDAARLTIERVFRDQEELPLATSLEDPIVEALKNSEWLIVICSPRLKESRWCLKEIETFIQLHGREKILTVLAEGEPEDSFPDILLEREKRVQMMDGTYQTVKEAVEPLAADFRGNSNKEHLAAMRSEILRLLAPMFELNYDELRQRHREQRMKRILAGVSAAAVLSAGVAAASIFTAIRINNQKNQIEEQSKRIETQSQEIAQQSIAIQKQAEEISKQNDSLKETQAINLAENAMTLLESDDREGAVRLAYQSLTSFQGIEMPKTALGYRALLKCLNPYSVVSSKVAVKQVTTQGVIETIIVTDRGSRALISDVAKQLYIWDDAEQKLAIQIENPIKDMSYDSVVFLSEETILFRGENGIFRMDLVTGEYEMVIPDEELFSYFKCLRYDEENQRLYVVRSRGIVCYDARDYSELWQYRDEKTIPADKVRLAGKDRLAVVLNDSVTIVNPSQKAVIMEMGQIVFETEIPSEEYFERFLLYNDKVYTLSTNVHLQDKLAGGTDSILRCYDLMGNLIWERSDKSIYGNKMTIIEDVGVKSLVEVGKYGVLEVDAETGETYFSDFTDQKILYADATEKQLNYITAKPSLMHVTNRTNYGYSDSIISNLQKINAIERTATGILMTEENRNRAVFYSAMSGYELEDYDGEYQVPVVEVLQDKEAVSRAEELGIEQADMTKCITYDEAREYICVTYRDYQCRIIRLQDLAVICTFESLSTVNQVDEYLGKDSNGNIYWAAQREGYCFSSDYQFLGKIDYLRYVDHEENFLLMNIRESEELPIKAPIYTIEDLLRLAEENYDVEE